MGCPTECGLDENIVFSITTHDPDTGVLTDADAAPTYRIYEDETGTSIANGTMAVLDTGNTTGFYTELIAVTAANGFEAGKNYTIYIEAAVGGDTGGVAFSFKASNRITAAVINAEVNDVLNVDAKTELAAIPAANASLGDKIALMAMATRNGGAATATAVTVNKDGGTALGTGSLADNGTTFTRGKLA